MGRLKTSPPRLPVQEDRLKAVNPDSWRSDKTSAAQRGYGPKWRRARLEFLKANPVCIYCLRERRIRDAEVVDHKIPHRGDMVLFWDRTNWQALCGTCHNTTKKREEALM